MTSDDRSLDSLCDDESLHGASGHSVNSTSSVIVEDAKIKAAREERNVLGARETKGVRLLRLVAILVLTTAAALVSAAVYLIAREGEENSFQNENDASSSKIIESFQGSIGQLINSHDALSSTVTTLAEESGATFPNFTIPNFEALGASARISSKAMSITYFPYVTDEERKGWEAYSVEYQGYLEPSLSRENEYKVAQDIRYGYSDRRRAQWEEYQGGGAPPAGQDLSSQGFGGMRLVNEEISTDVKVPAPPGTGPYTPLWQASPVIAIPIITNFDFRQFEEWRNPFDEVIASSTATFGWMSSVAIIGDASNLDTTLGNSQYRHTFEEYAGESLTAFAYPVFDTLNLTDRKVVGIFGSNVYWRLMLQNVLPATGDDFVVVIKNTIGQAESYKINGPEVLYLGTGDRHDPAFDEMETAETVADLIDAKTGPETRSYTAVDLQSDYVSYSLHVYPTASMETNYLTKQPAQLAAGVASIFMFTMFIFVLFNCLVERRQRLVMDRAAKSTAVVKSLFPVNIQERLYENVEEPKSSQKSTKLNSKERFQSNSVGAALMSSSASNVTGSAVSGSPIADLFPSCTVFFADLVGFTQWSSDRNPSDVFGLLETVFSAFDAIASKRGVFKVETIGDCYVAITGCPESQDDHAVRMTKFAEHCLLKMRSLLLPLTSKFGGNTSDLTIRIGLHSGPVTAGVLRGDRGRFQLFGDTVNTAARMVSCPLQ
jgi:class 3 adenylate cyclase